MRRLSFSGGEALENHLKEIIAKTKKVGTLKVGFLEGAENKEGTSIPMIAAIHEFGAPAAGIPARPFFRSMIAEKSTRWGEALGKLAVHTNYDTEQTLDGMGQLIQGQLQEAIIDFNSVPLAEATIARKGFDAQLIDTSDMKNAVDYEVGK